MAKNQVWVPLMAPAKPVKTNIVETKVGPRVMQVRDNGSGRDRYQFTVKLKISKKIDLQQKWFGEAVKTLQEAKNLAVLFAEKMQNLASNSVKMTPLDLEVFAYESVLSEVYLKDNDLDNPFFLSLGDQESDYAKDYQDEDDEDEEDEEDEEESHRTPWKPSKGGSCWTMTDDGIEFKLELIRGKVNLSITGKFDQVRENIVQFDSVDDGKKTVLACLDKHENSLRNDLRRLWVFIIGAKRSLTESMISKTGSPFTWDYEDEFEEATYQLDFAELVIDCRKNGNFYWFIRRDDNHGEESEHSRKYYSWTAAALDAESFLKATPETISRFRKQFEFLLK